MAANSRENGKSQMTTEHRQGMATLRLSLFQSCDKLIQSNRLNEIGRKVQSPTVLGTNSLSKTLNGVQNSQPQFYSLVVLTMTFTTSQISLHFVAFALYL